MTSDFDFAYIDRTKQLPILQSVGEVIGNFQLDNLKHNFYHQDAFFQQGESLVITMTTYDRDAIKNILSEGVNMINNENAPIYNILKHQELYNSIMSIKAVNRQLEDLLIDIKGEANKVKVEEKEAPIKDNPSLVEVLNEGQFYIKEYVDRAHEQILMIEELLFRR